MPRRTFEAGTFHVYNRGFEKMIIFKNRSDFERFYSLIIKYTKSEKYNEISILAYSLLPNHFHFIVSTAGEEISQFFGDIQNAYGKYFNQKYQRKGSLFEGRFKAKLIHSEEYLAKCLAYVNFNPVKHSLVANIDDYPYTSYHQLSNKDSILRYSDLILEELEF